MIFLSLLLQVYAESTPPPPPPPCTIQSAGCYKRGDVKADFGELSPSDFNYFLPENKCKREGSCDCRGVPDNIAVENDPDGSGGACTCIAGTDWNAKARCCGDDEDDCGKISSGILCNINANAESSQWISSEPSLGDIRYVGCTKAEYLSDGNTWTKCDGTFWRKAVGGNEYICIGKGRESIVECYGDGSPKSRVDGKRLSTGQSVSPEDFPNEPTAREECDTITKICGKIDNCDGESFAQEDCILSNAQTPSGGPVFNCKKTVCKIVTVPTPPIADTKTYYCRKDKKLVTDLDVPNPKINDKTLIANSKATCEKAELRWTGTKCCSEDDDENEFYNDPNEDGGCWDKNAVISVNFVEGTGDSVVNYKGEFHGCAIEESNFNKDNDKLLEIVDTHTGGSLVTDNEYCTTDTDNKNYCSYTEKWLPTEGADRTHLSFAPVQNPKQKGECCAKDECWDGEKCTANQKDNPLSQPINGSRCIEGEWTQSGLKPTPDGETAGYCPKATQCLAKPSGQTSCIEPSEYTEDNYCESGEWSTRTKLIGLKLLEMKSGDYTLLCDSRENALNNLQYLTSSNDAIANVLNNLQTNNFCVLKTGSKIITAASINKNIEEAPSSSLNIFGVTSCNNALIDDGQYHSCDGTNKVWYNKRLKSLIYSSTAITVPLGQAPFEEAIFGPINSIIKSIQDLIGKGPSGDESYVNAFKRFDKLYMSQQGTQSIKGSIEGKLKFPFFKNSVIEYKNIDADICRFVGQYTQAKAKDDSSGISCRKDGSNYYILAQGSQSTSINPEAIWLDLTSKLRLK
ncbi:hypothetical protein HYT53_03240 [Candidatus Woesearchaeota archaeon]|nr:hypothetical protein [Candidatus Woesearchaeota archaeon]